MFTSIYLIACMYGMFTYIYHKYQPNVGKYTTSPMDAIGYGVCHPSFLGPTDWFP